ncbi:hypothetical protein SPRG_03744 [Saprolegnia parasitica CBS 223.65]|uniref:FYVE-type domain-containing protein n=1 Tax=Saprolegnia parasitica (strain CBS 223.65) TaxID=695850 RepID=A0A067CMA9_SAPPC|nr:hypothetical protein SPRG_03744 [Saprolegnia parasitica CBS 223.65]KDO31824.1 hypothetical protein SPRG_03744 [Saprolegnia parasitica CBS 223.65]|eukprot:XP_012197703.1 hypothetical protein SPRG_03744 [Saprolegnia parasitica CBS 223.65]
MALPVSIVRAGVEASVVDRLSRPIKDVAWRHSDDCAVCAKAFTGFRHPHVCHLCASVICGACTERVSVERPSARKQRADATALHARVCKDCFFRTFRGRRKSIASTEARIELSSGANRPYYYPDANLQFTGTLRLPPRIVLEANAASPLATDRPDVCTLAAYDELETQREERLDILVALARSAYNCPIAIVARLDRTRGMLTVQARNGWHVERFEAESMLGQDALDDVIVLLNAPRDGYASHPFVRGPPYLRFYASAPIYSSSTVQAVVGLIFVADTLPRQRCDATRLVNLAKIAAPIVAVM